MGNPKLNKHINNNASLFHLSFAISEQKFASTYEFTTNKQMILLKNSKQVYFLLAFKVK